MLNRGVIRCYRVESAIRIDPTDVDDYLAARIDARQAA
jgi:hypothetical protein